MINRIRSGISGTGGIAVAVFVSLTLAVLVFFHFITRIAQPELQSFPDRSIGITVLSGIDSNLRTLWYCALVAGIILQSTLCFLLIAGLSGKFIPPERRYGSAATRSMLVSLAAVAAFLSLYGVIRNEPFILNMAWAFLGFTGLSFLALVFGSRKGLAGYFRDQSLPVLSLLLAFYLPFLRFSVTGAPVLPDLPGVVFFLLASALLFAGLPLLLKAGGLAPERLRSANLTAALVLALVPVALPLANELQFAVRGLSVLPPGGMGRILAGVAGVVAAGLWTFRVARPGRFSTRRFTAGFLFPVLITGFFLCSEADRTLTFKSFDLFHNGERMLVTQQWFIFGKIPFLDIIPTHGIMDFFGQSLYSLVNGYRGPEMFLWRWVPELAGILLLYFALNRFIAPFFSFLVVVATPVTFLFNDYYRLALVVPLLLDRVALRYGFRQFSILWLVVVLLFFWRYDFGVIATIVTLALIPGMIPGGLRSNSPAEILKRVMQPVLAMIALFVLAAGLYALLLLLHGQRPGEWFGQFYYYFKSQAPTQSVNDLYSRISVEFFLEYIVSPLVASVYAVHYLWHLITGTRRWSGFRLVLTWLALFSLVMTMRTVQRHTLVEGFNPVLSFFLACALPFQFGILPVKARYLVFLGLMVVFAMLTATVAKRVFVKINPASLVPREEFCGTIVTKGKPDRITISDSSQFKNFSRFCSDYLAPGQTFFDFSNAPLLYVFANRPFPAHLIPNLYQACDPVEEFLIRRLDTVRTGGRLPFVLFRQNNSWDSIDGVPQPVRSYRVAEYIYRYYDPFGKVDNYEIWKEKGHEAGFPGVTGRVLPFREGLSSGCVDLTLLKLTPDSLLFITGERDPSLTDILDNHGFSDAGNGNRRSLVLEMHCDKPGPFQVFFSINGAPFSEKSSTSFPVAGSGLRERHLVALPALPRGTAITAMRFDPPSGAALTLYPPLLMDSPVQPLQQTEPQHFDLGSLPRAWARFDPRRAAETTEVLSTPSVSGSLQHRGDRLVVPVDAALDRSCGNYLHFYIRSKKKGEVTVAVGSGMRSSVRFTVYPGEEAFEYLVRISVLRDWLCGPAGPVVVKSSVPCEVEKILIRKGD